MIGYGILEKMLIAGDGGKDRNSFPYLTVGTVVDTNDPQEQGRIKASCPLLGDLADKEIEDIPWALYMTPFGGSTGDLARGANSELSTTTTDVAYGFWGRPKVGAQVIICCLDGNPMFRVCIGCVYAPFTPHTMPHGRFTIQDSSVLDGTGSQKPDGPYSSQEGVILPTYNNFQSAFNQNIANSKEWQTRVADYTVSALDPRNVEQVYSRLADDKDIAYDGTSFKQGYAIDRNILGKTTSPITGKVYDSQTYSFSTPGFHAMSMDDREENCRMRFRTTSGHQIILDDTNERIYISTAKGENWVEMDQNGNIDIHSERRVSIHAAKDINFTTEETFRVHATKGIHLYSGDETRIHSIKDIHIRTEQNIRQHAAQTVKVQSDTDMHILSGATLNTTSSSDTNIKAGANLNSQSASDFNVKADSNLNLESGSNLNTKAGSNINIEAASDMNLMAGTQILETALSIHLNGPPASPAASAASAAQAAAASEYQAFWTNRVPGHENWGRIMMNSGSTDGNSGNSHVLQLGYLDSQVGKLELTDTITRGPHWRR